MDKINGKILCAIAVLSLVGCADLAQKKDVDAMQQRVDVLEANLQSTGSKVKELEATNAELEEQNKKLALLNKKIEQQKESIDELKSAAFEIKAPSDLKVIKLTDETVRPEAAYETPAEPEAEPIAEGTLPQKFASKTVTAKKESVISGDINEGEPLTNGEGTRILSTTPPTKETESIYKNGMDLYNAGKYEEARKVFASLAAKYPTTNLADNAIYWIGESYYTEKAYENAIRKFTDLVKRYPKENKTPDALLKAGFAYIELGKPDSAKKILSKVVQLYPDTDAATRAKEKLKGL